MLRSTLTALLLAPLVAFADDDAPNVEREKLQGTWISVKGYKANGEELPPEVHKEANFRVTISGETLTNSTAIGRPATFKFTLDPNQSPKAIDLISNRAGAPPRLGIYRVKDDTLEISWGGSSSLGRPTELIPCPKDS